MQGMCRSMMIIKMMIHEPSPIFDKQKNIILYQKTVERRAKSFILIEFGDDIKNSTFGWVKPHLPFVKNCYDCELVYKI